MRKSQEALDDVTPLLRRDAAAVGHDPSDQPTISAPWDAEALTPETTPASLAPKAAPSYRRSLFRR